MAQGKCDCGLWKWDGEQWTDGEEFGVDKCPNCGAELRKGGYAVGFKDRLRGLPTFGKRDPTNPSKRRTWEDTQ